MNYIVGRRSLGKPLQSEAVQQTWGTDDVCLLTLAQQLLNPCCGQSERVCLPEIGFCQVKRRLLDEFLEAIKEVTLLLRQQTKAIIEWDSDFLRYDVLLYLAHEKREAAKYALIAHIEAHHCGEG